MNDVLEANAVLNSIKSNSFYFCIKI